MRYTLISSTGAIALFMFSVCSLGEAVSSHGSADQAFLDQLLGVWVMDGDVRGHDVHYRAEGRRILNGAWIEFHMIDTASPTQYEASVFIAPDESKHDYVAHWLDRFGGAGARVTATGTRKDQTLVVTFPYSEGAFRNAWTFDPATHNWQLTIDAEKTSGSWSHFAHYTIRRMRSTTDRNAMTH